MKTLIAGYFAGEFGWQLMSWQAKIRYLSKQFDNVIIGCEPQYRYLYQDFCFEFIDFEEKILSRNMWMCNNRTTKIDQKILDIYNTQNYICPDKEFCTNDINKSAFIKYGSKIDQQYDVLIHARSTDNLGTAYRNYQIYNWDNVVSLLGDIKIASIGSIKESYHIKNTEDLRGVPLDELCDIMASSKVLLSPSSGTAHLAALCGLRHIVWSDLKTIGIMNNKERYLDKWNPFKTECDFIPFQYPKPELIVSKI